MSAREQLERRELAARADIAEQKSKVIPYFSWVKRYWSARGEKLDFHSHKYLNKIYTDLHPFIVYMKSSQVGLTERMITEALWIPDQYNENCIYFFPTSSTMGDLVQERIDDPINNNRYLAGVSGRAKKTLGKQADKVSLKKMSKGFVYFRGSNSPTQITSVSGDAIFADEVDRMVQENIPYFDKRLTHSKRPRQRWASTPTLPGYGIHKMFMNSDQQEYHIKCNHCGHDQVLDFWNNVKWEEVGEEIVNERIVCFKCDETIIPWHLDGEWIAKYPEKAVGNTGIRGYHISQLYSPRCKLKEIIEGSKTLADWELQQWYNQSLGVPYEPKGAKIDDSVFEAAKRDYTIPFKQSVERVYMGVDVGKVLHTIIRTKTRIVWIGEVKDFEGPVNSLEALFKEFNVKGAVLDALPETRKAQEFAAKFKGRVSLCWYGGVDKPKEGEWFNRDKEKVSTDRTISLDVTSAELRNQGLELPKNLDSYKDFKDHMKNLIRTITENTKGEKRAEYVETGPDHFYHAMNYAKIAAKTFDVAMPEVFTV